MAAILLNLNATGIGTPVMDMIRRQPISARVWGVYFNHGDHRVVVDHREIRLGKGWVVARLQTLLLTNWVHLPKSEEARIQADELMAYEIKVSEDANDRYGRFKVRSPDDLVTALGLALQAEGVDLHGVRRMTGRSRGRRWAPPAQVNVAAQAECC